MKNTAKRFLLVLLAFVMILSFAACGDKDSEIDPDDDEEYSETEDPEIQDQTNPPSDNTAEASATVSAETVAPKTAEQKTDAPKTQAPTQAPTKAPESQAPIEESVQQTTQAPETAAPTVDENATPAVPTKCKVIILIGQSNAVGATYINVATGKSDTDTVRKVVGSVKYNFYKKTGFPNVRINYWSSGDTATRTNCDSDAIAKASYAKAFPKVDLTTGSWVDVMFGPELGMADYLTENCPGEQFFIIKVAKGGVDLTTFLPGATHYNELEKRFNASMKRLKDFNWIPEVVGICWMQGENEASKMSDKVTNYQSNTVKLAAAVRSLCKDYAAPGGIAWIDAGIWESRTCAKEINAAKQAYAATSDLNYFFITTDFTMDSVHNNWAHYDVPSVLKLGKRFGEYIKKSYDEHNK